MRSGLEWRRARVLETEYAISAIGLVYGSRPGDRRATQVRTFKYTGRWVGTLFLPQHFALTTANFTCRQPYPPPGKDRNLVRGQ